MKKFAELIRTEALLFLRDFFSFFFAFAFPVMMLLLYGSIYGNAPTPYFTGLGTMDVSVPAYSAMIVGVTGLMAFPLTLSGRKENKVYKRFDATPAGKGIVIAAQAAVNFCMTLAGFTLLFFTGRLLYNIKVPGSLLMIILALFLSVGAIFALGFLFTAIAPNDKISNLLCYISYFVMIFLSGSTLPKKMFPEPVKMVSEFLPLTHVVNVLQGTFRGAAFKEYRKSAVILAALFLVCLCAGGLLYKKKSWA